MQRTNSNPIIDRMPSNQQLIPMAESLKNLYSLNNNCNHNSQWNGNQWTEQSCNDGRAGNINAVGASNPHRCIAARPSLPSRLLDTSTVHSSSLPTYPVPEFLCHVLSMVQDPALSHIISWEICNDETDLLTLHKGKIVIHCPSLFQSKVLGRYYRHSKFSSFQRQMNYFGFKKRVLPIVNSATAGVRGKLNACEFVNEKLGTEKVTLLALKKKMKRVNKNKSQLHDNQCSNTWSHHSMVAEPSTNAHDAINAAQPEDSYNGPSFGNRHLINSTNVAPSAFQSEMRREQTDKYLMTCNPLTGSKGANLSNAQFLSRPQVLTQVSSGGCTFRTRETTSVNAMNNKSDSLVATIVPLHQSFMSQMSRSMMLYPQQSFVNQKYLPKPSFNDSSKNNGVNTNQATVIAAQEAKKSLLQAYQQSQFNLLLQQQMINNGKRKNEDSCSHNLFGAKQPRHIPANMAVYHHFQKTKDSPENFEHGLTSVEVPISVVADPEHVDHLPLSQLQQLHEHQPIPTTPLASQHAVIKNKPHKRSLSAIPLPKSIDELFNDGSVCSELCDEDELKDADDCSLLSVELGLAG